MIYKAAACLMITIMLLYLPKRILAASINYELSFSNNEGGEAYLIEASEDTEVFFQPNATNTADHYQAITSDPNLSPASNVSSANDKENKSLVQSVLSKAPDFFTAFLGSGIATAIVNDWMRRRNERRDEMKRAYKCIRNVLGTYADELNSDKSNAISITEAVLSRLDSVEIEDDLMIYLKKKKHKKAFDVLKKTMKDEIQTIGNNGRTAQAAAEAIVSKVKKYIGKRDDANE